MATKIITPQTIPDQSPVVVLIDHLTATLPLSQMAALLDLIGAEDWEKLPYGRRGYTSGMTRDGLQIHYGGDACRNKAGEETLHVIIHGSGCRLLEGQGVINVKRGEAPHTWETFIAFLLSLGGAVRRIDLAIDEHTGTLLPQMVEALQSDKFTTRYKEMGGYIDFRRGRVRSDQVEGLTFGNRASQAYIRAYDKASEQRAKGKPYEGECTRVEVEFKGNKAQAVASRIAASGSLDFLPGMIRSLLDFKEETGDRSKHRWPTVHWWASFLGHCSKVRLAVDPIHRSIEKVEEWIRRQVAPNLALLFTHYQGEWGRLEALMTQGRTRWKKRHRDLLPDLFPVLQLSKQAVT